MAAPSLEGRVVLLTGASSGIGWASALALAGHRPRLALAARRAEKLAELSGLLRAEGVETIEFPCDVSDPAQARGAVEAAVKRWGRLDVLINNAGVQREGRFHEQPWGDVESVLRTNYLGAAAAIHQALPHMLRQGRGHVVNVASMAGLLGLPYMAAYCGSKFALVGMTDSLRREYYGTGVTFTALCFGSVETPMAEASLKDKKLGRLARPKTAAQAARKVVDCCLRRPPELIYGDAPGVLVKFSRFLPGAVDWLAHQIYSRAHPLGRRNKL